MNWIPIAEDGLVDATRIVAVAHIESAPIRRMIRDMPLSQVVVLTGGQKRQTVLVLDSGHAVITPLTLEEVVSLLKNEKREIRN
ncbi:MAG: DUF370 domain-containing protein [Anaerolineae bacterium]|nr:DUF370 domain-containing protein [Anaerolineae bacterium]